MGYIYYVVFILKLYLWFSVLSIDWDVTLMLAIYKFFKSHLDCCTFVFIKSSNFNVLINNVIMRQKINKINLFSRLIIKRHIILYYLVHLADK